MRERRIRRDGCPQAQGGIAPSLDLPPLPPAPRALALTSPSRAVSLQIQLAGKESPVLRDLHPKEKNGGKKGGPRRGELLRSSSSRGCLQRRRPNCIFKVQADTSVDPNKLAQEYAGPHTTQPDQLLARRLRVHKVSPRNFSSRAPFCQTVLKNYALSHTDQVPTFSEPEGSNQADPAGRDVTPKSEVRKLSPSSQLQWSASSLPCQKTLRTMTHSSTTYRPCGKYPVSKFVDKAEGITVCRALFYQAGLTSLALSHTDQVPKHKKTEQGKQEAPWDVPPPPRVRPWAKRLKHVPTNASKFNSTDPDKRRWLRTKGYDSRSWLSASPTPAPLRAAPREKRTPPSRRRTRLSAALEPSSGLGPAHEGCPVRDVLVADNIITPDQESEPDIVVEEHTESVQQKNRIECIPAALLKIPKCTRWASQYALK